MPAVTVYGLPSPKGSLKCIGSRGRGAHQLVEDERVGQKEWRARVGQAGRALLATLPAPYAGPVAVQATITLPRPKSVPLAARAWPHRKNAPDVDKLGRMILDALGDAGLYGDDAQVVDLHVRKCYPDTPGVLDALDRPGAVIRTQPWKDT